jgi:lysylphosphatidylglycerol synthetase-like protein (DUF2156 family)
MANRHALPPEAPLDRARVVRLVRTWGGANSAAVLDSRTDLFVPDQIEGLIGFRRAPGVAVVFGDPVCAPEERERIVGLFHQQCAREGRSIVYLCASDEFQRQAVAKGWCAISLEYGEELTLTAQVDPRARTGVDASLVRRKVRHAQKEQVEVREYVGDDPHIEAQIERVGLRWSAARKGPQIHISHLEPFADREGRRWFAAFRADQIVGALVMNEVRSLRGWAFNHLLIDPDAPGGVPESLVVMALDRLRAEGHELVTFGAVPNGHLGAIHGLPSWMAHLLRCAFPWMTRWLPIHGRKKFVEKFGPQASPSYLLFSRSWIGLTEVLGLMRSMNIRMQ